MSHLSDERIEREIGIDHHKEIDWTEFLTNAPPGKGACIHRLADTASAKHPGSPSSVLMMLPILRLECRSAECSNGIRNFQCSEEHYTSSRWRSCVIEYLCRDCRNYVTSFAIAAKTSGDRSTNGQFSGIAVKIGQWPAFGPSVPSRVITLIGPDRELFLKGRRAESQGMGIAAFAYYRRVVENQKDRLLDEIVKVAKKNEADKHIVSIIEQSKKQQQFSRAVESVKDAIPSVLRINGRNPLTLLHTALSQGLHAETDEACLELASSIRIVLTALAEGLGQALKDRAELDAAVNRLSQTKRANQ